MRSLRAGAVKGGGDIRGTAMIEDGAGLAARAIARDPVRRLRPRDRRRRPAPARAGPRGRAGTRGSASCAEAYDSARDEEGRPGRRRRPRAGASRPRARRGPRADDRGPHRRRVAHRPVRLDVPVADAGLPVGARHGRASGRLAHPRDDVVPPRRGPVRGVRLLVRGDARRGDAADGRRHPGQPEPAPPLAAGDDGVRGARGRRARHRGGQPLRVPRPRTASDHAARRPPLRPHHRDRRRGVRAAPVLPRRPLLLRPDRARRATSAPASTATAAPSPGGSSPGTASTSCSCTCTRPTRPAIAEAT